MRIEVRSKPWMTLEYCTYAMPSAVPFVLRYSSHVHVRGEGRRLSGDVCDFRCFAVHLKY